MGGARMRVVCPTCGETRELGYQAVWRIRRGFNSGDCNSCATRKKAGPHRDRVLARIKQRGPDECWIRDGYHTSLGYAMFHDATGAPTGAYRCAYEALVGPIPDGMTIDHLCRNRACVNPAHLEPVTHAENLRRAAEATRTDHCPAGHLFDSANTYTDRNGYRKCRACRREKAKAAYHEGRAKCA